MDGRAGAVRAIAVAVIRAWAEVVRVDTASNGGQAMQGARWWLVCYDVRDPDRLRKAAKHVEGYGERVQYSVFRCWMTARQMEQLRWELTAILASEDDILLIPICGPVPRASAAPAATANRPGGLANHQAM